MSTVQVHCDKRISPAEFASLMASVGWGAEGDYDPELVRQSIEHYPFVAHARTEDDALVDYVSAFSDGVFSTFIGELVVHPEFQRQGVVPSSFRLSNQTTQVFRYMPSHSPINRASSCAMVTVCPNAPCPLSRNDRDFGCSASENG